MPHRCTKCGATFGDGDPVILTGCPNCKWNKFLYVGPEALKGEDENTGGQKENIPEKENLDDVLKNIDDVLDSEELKIDDPAEDRVEAIRIVDAGSYEVNLESVMNNDEIVVGIKEEGQYAIDLSSMLKGSGKKEKTKGRK